MAAEFEPEDNEEPLRRIFWRQRDLRFHLGDVQSIDMAAEVVRTSDHEVHYDY
jgi:NADH dehydrogenase FAD-containing subunit